MQNWNYHGTTQQQFSQQRQGRKQSPALESPLPEFVPPQGQRGQGVCSADAFEGLGSRWHSVLSVVCVWPPLCGLTAPVQNPSAHMQTS